MKRFYFKSILIAVFFLGGAINVFAISSYEVPILVYHSFGLAKNAQEKTLQTHYRVTADTFEKQMKYLSDNAYHPISFSAYVDSFKNNTKLPKKAIVLSFDDGWKTQYIYAVPILEKYDFTATFFIVASYPGSRLYMSWNDLKDLVVHNFDIESHTKTHAMLTKISSEKLTSELNESKKMLEAKLNIKVTTFAYPYYAQNLVVRDAVKFAGYIGARGGWGKFKNSIDHIYELKAQEVVNNPNPFLYKRLPDLP